MNDRQGRLVAIVGPSGVGKDSIMVALKQRFPDVHLIKRVITRDAKLGGEDFEAVTEDQFQKMKLKDAFALDWTAHGLKYGIPRSVDQQIKDGHIVIFNGSRGALSAAKEKYPNMLIVLITASEKTLTKRLTERGREAKADIGKRLQRASYNMPDWLDYETVSNDGLLDEAIDQVARLIIPSRESAQ